MLQFFVRPGQSGRESFRFGHSVIATILCGLAAVASQAAEPKLLKVPADKDWKIEIIPGPAIGPSPAPKAVQATRQAQAAKADELLEKLPPLPAPEVAAGIVAAEAKPALPAGINPASYTEVYNSIPFRRSEYLANPSYRHDATIELMLGQIRQKTVTNVIVGSATCCSPQTAMFDKWFAPWGTNAFDDRFSRYRP